MAFTVSPLPLLAAIRQGSQPSVRWAAHMICNDFPPTLHGHYRWRCMTEDRPENDLFVQNLLYEAFLKFLPDINGSSGQKIYAMEVKDPRDTFASFSGFRANCPVTVILDSWF